MCIRLRNQVYFNCHEGGGNPDYAPWDLLRNMLRVPRGFQLLRIDSKHETNYYAATCFTPQARSCLPAHQHDIAGSMTERSERDLLDDSVSIGARILPARSRRRTRRIPFHQHRLCVLVFRIIEVNWKRRSPTRSPIRKSKSRKAKRLPAYLAD